MALLFMDGFDAGDYAKGKYSSYSTPGTTAVTRFSSGKALSLPANAGWHIQRAFTASTEVFAGFAMYINVNTYGTSILTFYGDGGATKHTSLRRVSTVQWGIYRGETQLSTFTAPNSATWLYVEVSSTIADAGGTVVIRINGVVAGSFTGDTKNGGTNNTIDMMRIGDDGGNYPACAPYIDDLYICNSAGTANNTFLGDVRVQTLLPTGAGSSTQLSPTGGANYANVADVPDSVATYNSSINVGDRDTYTMGDLASGTTSVFGIQDNLAAWKADAGTGNLKSALKVGPTVYYGSTIGLGTSPGVWYGAVRETNPATSTTWAPAEVNGIEFGAEVA